MDVDSVVWMADLLVLSLVDELAGGRDDELAVRKEHGMVDWKEPLLAAVRAALWENWKVVMSGSEKADWLVG